MTYIHEIKEHKVGKDVRYKTITSIPEALRRSDTSDKLSGTSGAYAGVPVLYRAIRLRCDSLSSVPVKIKTKRGKEVDWPFSVPADSLIWMTEAALLLTGAAFWHKLKNAVRTVDVEWVNPYTVDVRYTDGKTEFRHSPNDKLSAIWDESKVVYFREFHPTDDVGPGIAPAAVAFTDAELRRYMRRFAARFFEGGAMPVTVVSFDADPAPEELTRLERFFTKAATSIRNAFRVLATRSGVKMAQLTPAVNTLAMPELDRLTLASIAHAFGIPVTMLDDAANYATATEHRESFWQDTIRPRGVYLAGVINRSLLAPLGLTIEFAFDEMDVFQKDEATRAVALGQLTAAGIPLEVALRVLGFDLAEEDWNAIRKSEKEREERADEIAGNVAGAAAEDKKDEEDPAGAAAGKMARDLSKWERKSIKRLKDGRGAACDFLSDAIGTDLAAVIADELTRAETAEDVRTAFKTAAFYERQVRRAILDLYRSGDGGAFIDDMTVAIREQLLRAWREGARDVGFALDEIEPEDYEPVEDRIRAEYEFIIGLADDVIAGREEGKAESVFTSRAPLWAARYLEVVNMARLYFSNNGKFEWVIGATEEHCSTCLKLNGIVAKKSRWDAAGVRPQGAPNPRLECEGWRCQCELVPTKKRQTRGGIPNV